jgi:ribosomal protein S13
LQTEQLKKEETMAMSIKSIPVLTGKTAMKFIAEADNNKNQATPTLSEKSAERLKKVLEKSKSFSF